MNKNMTLKLVGIMCAWILFFAIVIEFKSRTALMFAPFMLIASLGYFFWLTIKTTNK
jgi:hypothetical protein